MTTHQSQPLGISLTEAGGTFRVHSKTATEILFNILGDSNTRDVIKKLPLTKISDCIWELHSEEIVAGVNYTLSAAGPEGPRHAFNSERHLLDPYARGLAGESPVDYHCVVVTGEFDWQGVEKPNRTMAETIIYEAHLRGLTRINPEIPEEIRGSYAALGHPATISHLKKIGITAIELLPIHSIISEPRLINLGLTNYWGYNTINFFSPHGRYASQQAIEAGPQAIIDELKTSIRELHRAGIEVILDVVYNHTAEGGSNGLTYSYRGLDNSGYYRQDDAGNYHDTTGCGNSLDFSNPAVVQLVLDSLRYWTEEFQIDGYRFDLATTLARNEMNHYDQNHPLLRAIRSDPLISQTKTLVEPWDVGVGGWQTGNFPWGFPEWNDRYRDSVRKFWLEDVAAARFDGSYSSGVADLATRLAGSADMLHGGDGPLGGVNFVTAHDGFTLSDLVSYNLKRNSSNGESNRDGTDGNRSFNHGVEGETEDQAINFVRRKAMRNLLGTLMFSSGVPMITAGDERAKTQLGNNNAYCQDNSISWIDWSLDSHQSDLEETFAFLSALRLNHPVLRPSAFNHESLPTATNDQMLWFNSAGSQMSLEDWHNPQRRALQRYTAHINNEGYVDAMLLVINGREKNRNIILPALASKDSFKLLWDSSLELPPKRSTTFPTGSEVKMVSTSMQLFQCN